MRKDKEKAIQLRLSGLSYKKINKELGVPIGTLAGWFKNQPWSERIKNRLSSNESLANPRKLELMSLANKARWESRRQEHRNAATREFEKLKRDPLFLAGVMLYWGEGEKQAKYSTVTFRNSDPEMIKLFYFFLTKTLKISSDKITAWLLLYPDLVDSVQKNFWSKMTGISIENFRKSAYIKGKSPKRRLSYGVCTVSIHSRALKERMLKWIDLYQNLLKSHSLRLEK